MQINKIVTSTILAVFIAAFIVGCSADLSQSVDVAQNDNISQDADVSQSEADGTNEQDLSVELEENDPTKGKTVVDNVADQQGDVSKSDNRDSAATEGEETIRVSGTFDLKDIPVYDGKLYVEINNNVSFFTEEEMTTEAFEEYSELDSLGRCGVAYANVCKDTMPTEKRGNISGIHPSGWVQNKYPGIVDSQPPYLYNRCHLIAYKLAGENANEKNLITGTRCFNEQGMLPFEDEVWEWANSCHVLYRVTPYFEGDNLVATGVLMEAKSIEKNGLEFCVFVYNVQPGIYIDYSDGSNHKEDEDSFIQITEYNGGDNTEAEGERQFSVDSETGTDRSNSVSVTDNNNGTTEAGNGRNVSADTTYILNSGTMKFHRPTCKSVKQIADRNYHETTQTRDEVINAGYSPCKNCNP